MLLEIKGLLVGIAAAAAVLGATFAIASIITPQSRLSIDDPKAAAAVGPKTPTNQLIAAGQQFFSVSCSSCHGANGEGGYGPSLYNSKRSDPQIISVIKKGVPGKMPPFAAKYQDSQIQALTAYLRSLKH